MLTKLGVPKMDTSLKVPTVCMDGSPGRGWRRILLWGSLASISAILLIRQQLLPRVLYYRRRYSEEIEYYTMITTRFAAYHKMPYSIAWRGEKYGQVAYVVPPVVANRPPSKAAWILLGGNAMLAKDWLPFVHSVRHSDLTGELDRATFLLVDYPGYGESQGPSSLNPDSINAVVHAAVEALLTRQPHEFDSIHTLGHSLGGAVALRFAREGIAKDYLRVRSVITSSTFTSVAAMIRSIVGLPLPLSKLLASHEWSSMENMAHIKEAGVEVAMVHGLHDEIVPYSHGEELSKVSNVVLFTHPTAMHNDILNLWVPKYSQLMTSMSKAKL